MRVLIINKFLYPNGGSETYIFKLGEALEQHGHEVQYFGMEHEGRCVGNRVNAYTSDMDFHGGSKLSKLTYPIKTIYSKEARVQLRKVLDDFKPDVCHGSKGGGNINLCAAADYPRRAGNNVLRHIEHRHSDVKGVRHKVDCHKRLEHPLEEHGSVNVVHIVLFRYHADKLIA